MTDLYSLLVSAVKEASVLRVVVNLRPASADGLVYPPTYEGGEHVFRPAWIDGQRREAVLLDSVQSQSNRIEMAILDAHRRGVIQYPDIELVIRPNTGEEHYSVLQLSHRVYDAALRMSTIDGIPFSESEVGRAVYRARTERATGLYIHAPITLTLGGWDSHGGGGPLAAKLPRLVTSEIVGLDAEPVERRAVKFDPMDVRKEAGPLYESKDPDRRFEVDKEKASGKKKYDPSELGLGNVPHSSRRGAVITEAVQTSIFSLAAARRLRFEIEDESWDRKRDHAGQAATVALGLFGLLAQMEAGYYLRSGCDLVPTRKPRLEIIQRTLEDVESHEISADDAGRALEKALEEANGFGLSWRSDPIVAVADELLTTLIERSRTAKSGGE